ncbi:SCO2400 family protein [Streptomyces sp. H39-S7]|uniref:SCO2400 family protein n=1 Tax=Streptomyces sp. H39-S7 TaxID=3004357 RepID=UPI003FA7A40A
MDYCYSCRRHLNGALSCPGCGTPVDQLAAPVEPAPVTGAPTAPPEPDATGGRAARRRPPRRARRRGGKRLVTGVGVGIVLIACTAAALASGTFASGPGADTGPTRAPAADSAPQVAEASPTPRRTTTRPAHSSPSTTVSTSGTPSGSPSATPSGSRTPTRSASPTTRSPTAPTTSKPPTPTRTPKPSHSPTCKPVLWWCE